MKGLVLNYVASVAHCRNCLLLSENIPELEFVLCYEKSNRSLAEICKKFTGLESIGIGWHSNFTKIFRLTPKAIIFSALHKNIIPLRLFSYALEKTIVTIAIEESNQIVTNNGKVNNYLIQPDYLLVASKYEKDGMTRHGLNSSRIEVTGWPFLAKEVIFDNSISRAKQKEELGLDPIRKTALVTFSQLHVGAESVALRDRQLRLIGASLDDNYQFVFKPHPTEEKDFLREYIKEKIPDGVVIDREIPISKLLVIADVVVTRGSSQTIFEALMMGIPAVLLNVGEGMQLFNYDSVEAVSDEGDLIYRIKSALFSENAKVDKELMSDHVPFSPQQALSNVIGSLREAILKGPRIESKNELALVAALFFAWLGSKKEAIRVLEKTNSMYPPIKALMRLAEERDPDQESIYVLKDYWRGSVYEGILFCIWLRVLEKYTKKINQFERNWLKEFVPIVHPIWYVEDIKRIFRMFTKCGLHSDINIFRARLQKTSGSDALFWTKLEKRFTLYEKCRHWFSILTRYNYF